MEQNGGPEYSAVSTSQTRRDLCARCGGLMVVEHYMDLQDETGQIDITALRCTSCGEVVDRVILENRFKPAPNLLYGTKQRKFAQRVDEGESAKTPAPSETGDDHADQEE